MPGLNRMEDLFLPSSWKLCQHFIASAGTFMKDPRN